MARSGEGRRAWWGSVGIAVVLAVGVIAAWETAPVSVEGSTAEVGQTSVWPTNRYGLTVGEPTPADLASRNLPDLVPARDEAGELGFLVADDFYAAAMGTAPGSGQRLDGRGQLVAEVVAADGVTPIGFTVVSRVAREHSEFTD